MTVIVKYFAIYQSKIVFVKYLHGAILSNLTLIFNGVIISNFTLIALKRVTCSS